MDMIPLGCLIFNLVIVSRLSISARLHYEGDLPYEENQLYSIRLRLIQSNTDSLIQGRPAKQIRDLSALGQPRGKAGRDVALAALDEIVGERDKRSIAISG
jgi:hypothetical protein